MNRLIALIVFSLITFTSVIEKSNAGVILLAVASSKRGCTGPSCPRQSYSMDVLGYTIAGAGAGALIYGIFLGVRGLPYGGLAIGAGAVLLTLDEQGNELDNALVFQTSEMLSKKFPFIDDQSVLNDLAYEILKKIDLSNADVNGNLLISLDESMVRNHLEQLNLSEEQVQLVVSQLK